MLEICRTKKKHETKNTIHLKQFTIALKQIKINAFDLHKLALFSNSFKTHKFIQFGNYSIHFLLSLAIYLNFIN